MAQWYVPQSYYFLWDDDKIVGWFKFRHQLCESLKRNGGHIGYVSILEGVEKVGGRCKNDNICGEFST